MSTTLSVAESDWSDITMTTTTATTTTKTTNFAWNSASFFAVAWKVEIYVLRGTLQKPLDGIERDVEGLREKGIIDLGERFGELLKMRKISVPSFPILGPVIPVPDQAMVNLRNPI